MEILREWRFLSTVDEARTLTIAILGAASAPVGVYLLGLGQASGPATVAIGVSSRWPVKEAVKRVVLAHQPNPLAGFTPFDIDVSGRSGDALAFYRVVPRRDTTYVTPDHVMTAARALQQIRGPMVGGLGMIVWGWHRGRAKVDVGAFAVGRARDDRGRPVDALSLAWGVGAGPSRGNAQGIARPLRVRRALRRFLRGSAPISLYLLRRSVDANELLGLWHLPAMAPGLGLQSQSQGQIRTPFQDPFRGR